MPRKPKDVKDMNDEEIARFVFPKKVVDEANRIAHEKDPKPKPKKSSRSSRN